MIIKKLKYGNTNTFYIKGEYGSLLLDTDYAGTQAAFYKAIKEQEIKLCDISYILATHYHPDHIGLVSELNKLGVKLLLIDIQLPYIHFSDRIFERDKRLKYEAVNTEMAVIITIDESRKFLESLGISGEIISTPSHSEDSVSMILDNGICFVGDLEPMEYLAAYDNNVKLDNDLKKIMGYDPKIIYYAHANEKIF